MKKIVAVLMATILMVTGMAGCGTKRTGPTLDEFISNYNSKVQIEALSGIAVNDAVENYDETTKQKSYKFVLDDFGDEYATKLTIKTDKKGFVDSVEIKMGELGVMAYAGEDFVDLLVYYATVLKCVDDSLSDKEVVDSVAELMSQSGGSKKVEINDKVRMRMNFETSSHTFTVYTER